MVRSPGWEITCPNPTCGKTSAIVLTANMSVNTEDKAVEVFVIAGCQWCGALLSSRYYQFDDLFRNKESNGLRSEC